LANKFESVSDSLSGAWLSLNWMAASDVNLDAAIQARFSGSVMFDRTIARTVSQGFVNVANPRLYVLARNRRFSFVCDSIPNVMEGIQGIPINTSAVYAVEGQAQLGTFGLVADKVFVCYVQLRMP
jgi:hypothetical protein